MAESNVDIEDLRSEYSDEESEYESCDDDDNETDIDDDSGDEDDDDSDDNDEDDDDDNNNDEDDDDDNNNDDDDEDDDEQDEPEEDDVDLLSNDDDDNPNASQCPVCLMSLRDQQLGTPSNCQHVFCYLCISEWSKNSNTCPIDRKKFDEILVHTTKKGPIIKKVKVEDKQVPNDQDWEQAPTYCEVCEQSNREAMMLLCDGCDRGYHMFCLTPRLYNVPEGDWYCDMCLVIRNETIPDVDMPPSQQSASIHSLPSSSAPSTSTIRRRSASTRGRGRGRRRTPSTRRPRSSSTRSRKTTKRARPKTKTTKTTTSKRGRSTSTTSKRKTKTKRTTKRKTTKRKRKRRTTTRKSPKKRRRIWEDDDSTNPAFLIPGRSSRERLSTGNALSILGNGFALHDFEADVEKEPIEKPVTPPKRPQTASTDVLSSIFDEIEVLHDGEARVSRDGRVLTSRDQQLPSKTTSTPPEKTEAHSYPRKSEKIVEKERSTLKRPLSPSSVEEYDRVKAKRVSFCGIKDEREKSQSCRYRSERTTLSQGSFLRGSSNEIPSERIPARIDYYSYKERLNERKPSRIDECRESSVSSNVIPAQMSSLQRYSNERSSEIKPSRFDEYRESSASSNAKISQSPSLHGYNYERSSERMPARIDEYRESSASGDVTPSQISPLHRYSNERSSKKANTRFNEYRESSATGNYNNVDDFINEKSKKGNNSERTSDIMSSSNSSNKTNFTPHSLGNSTSLMTSRDTSHPYVTSQSSLTPQPYSSTTSSSATMATVTSRYDNIRRLNLPQRNSSIASSPVTTTTVTSHGNPSGRLSLSRSSHSYTSSPVTTTTVTSQKDDVTRHQNLSSRFSDRSSTPPVPMTTIKSCNPRQIEFKDETKEIRVNLIPEYGQKTSSLPTLAQNPYHPTLPKLKSFKLNQNETARPKLKGLLSTYEKKSYPSLNASYPPMKPSDNNYRQNLAIIDMLRSKKSDLKAEMKREGITTKPKDANPFNTGNNSLSSQSFGAVNTTVHNTGVKSETDISLAEAQKHLYSSFETAKAIAHGGNSQVLPKLNSQKLETRAESPETTAKVGEHSRDGYSSLPTFFESSAQQEASFHRPKLHSLLNGTKRPSNLPVAVVKPSRTADNSNDVLTTSVVKLESSTPAVASGIPQLSYCDSAAQSTSLSVAEDERVENRRKGIVRLQRLTSIKDTVRLVLQPFYNHKEITKSEFKDIFTKAVQKVNQSSYSIDYIRISEFVKKYVKKCKGKRAQGVDHQSS